MGNRIAHRTTRNRCSGYGVDLGNGIAGLSVKCSNPVRNIVFDLVPDTRRLVVCSHTNANDSFIERVGNQQVDIPVVTTGCCCFNECCPKVQVKALDEFRGAM